MPKTIGMPVFRSPNRMENNVRASGLRAGSAEPGDAQRFGLVAGSLYDIRGQRKYLTANERVRFLEAADRLRDPRERTFCRTMALTGCRISEALALTGSSIIVDEGVVVLRTLKRRRGVIAYREVPIPNDLLSLLDQTHDLARGARLWPMGRTKAWELIKSVMQMAAISPGPHAMPKGLRHGFGLLAVRSGVPISILSRWLGHSHLASSLTYLQAVGREEREFAERMW